MSDTRCEGEKKQEKSEFVVRSSAITRQTYLEPMKKGVV